jgi:hypothetical protein
VRAGAVAADEAEDLAGAHLECDAVQRDHVPVALADPIDFQLAVHEKCDITMIGTGARRIP